MSSGDLDGKECLVDMDCITSIQAAIDNVHNGLVVVNPGYVSLSFVSNLDLKLRE